MTNKESIKYVDWQTGEEVTKELSFSHPSENKTGLTCAFDGTEILRCYDHMTKWYDCPNCDLPYENMKGKSQEEANRVAREHFQNLEKRLKKLSQEQEDIYLMLDHAEEQGIYTKNN